MQPFPSGPSAAGVGKEQPSIHLPIVEPTDAARARTRIRQAVADEWVEGYTEEMVLVATELVSNALRHGEPPAEFQLLLGEDRAIAAAYDSSLFLPTAGPSTPSLDTESGRGLFLVSELAHRSGAYHAGNGKWVYAEWLRGDAT